MYSIGKLRLQAFYVASPSINKEVTAVLNPVISSDILFICIDKKAF
jgi:hypothetical protein